MKCFWTDGRTDGKTDTVTYSVACTWLKSTLLCCWCLVQFANLNIRVADYFVEQSMKIVLLVYNMVFYNIRRGAHLSKPLGTPGGPQGKTKLSSEQCSASDYTTFTALGELISSQHTHIFLLTKAEEDAYWKDFIWPQEGGPKWPPRLTKLSAEPTK